MRCSGARREVILTATADSEAHGAVSSGGAPHAGALGRRVADPGLPVVARARVVVEADNLEHAEHCKGKVSGDVDITKYVWNYQTYIFLLCQLQPQQPQQPQVESCCPWRLAPVGRTRGTAPPGWQPPPLPAAPPASSKDRATLRSVPQCLQRIPSQFVGLQFHTHCCVSNSSAV